MSGTHGWMRRSLGPALALACALALCSLAGAQAEAQEGEARVLPATDAGSGASDGRIQRLRRMLSEQIFVLPDIIPAVDLEFRPAEEPFLPYADLVIRHIGTRRLDFFDSEGDPLGDAPWYVGLGSAMHFKSRAGQVKSYLLFSERERLRPFHLADSERILRSTDFIQDARILVHPVAGSADSVDVEVVTRDIWSLGGSVTVKSGERLTARLHERNLFGLGHDISNRVDIDTGPAGRTGYAGSYTASNLFGTFIDGRAAFSDREDEKFSSYRVSRTPVAPRINYRGAVEIRRDETSVEAGGVAESLILVTQDAWGSRAFPLGRDQRGDEARTQMTLGARVAKRNYAARPADPELRRGRYYERLQLLGSVSLSRDEFDKGRLIFGFGSTEDIPSGLLASFTGGLELGEFEDRGYAAFTLRSAAFRERYGYFAWEARIGGFLHANEIEDGVFRLTGDWFSELIALGRVGYRQFAGLAYTAGIRRHDGAQLMLGEETGLRGLTGSALLGNQRLVADLESVFFTPWRLIGFKLTLFSFLSGGLVGPADDGIWKSRFYSSVGCGMRLKNERLIFDAIELRVAYLPQALDAGDLSNFEAWNVNDPAFSSYRPGAPRTVPFE